MKKLLILSVFLAAALISLSSSNYAEKAPDFVANTFEGDSIKLSQLKGRVVLIDFWASWCGPCRKEMPFLVELHDQYKQMGLIILGVNIDNDMKKAMAFIDKLKDKPGFTLIWDKDKKLPPKFNVGSMPTTVIIDKKGMIRFVHSGFNEDKKEDFKKELEGLLKE